MEPDPVPVAERCEGEAASAPIVRRRERPGARLVTRASLFRDLGALLRDSSGVRRRARPALPAILKWLC